MLPPADVNPGLPPRDILPPATVTDGNLERISEILWQRMKENPNDFRGTPGNTPSIDIDDLARAVADRLPLPMQEFVILKDRNGDGVFTDSDGSIYGEVPDRSRSTSEVLRQRKPLGEPINIIVRGELRAD